MYLPDGPTQKRIASSRPDLRAIFELCTPAPIIKHATKNSTIAQEGEFADYSLLLLDGWMALSKILSTGEAQIIDVMLPGDFALIGARHAPFAACSVEALSDARYIIIPPEQANGAGPAAAELRGILAATIVTTQARTAEILLRMGKSSAASRVAYALLELYVRLEAVGLTKAATFTFPMTQQKLGEFAGLSNVHVCRTLRRFVRAGIVGYPNTTDIELGDLDALCEIAEIDLDTFRDGILLRRSM